MTRQRQPELVVAAVQAGDVAAELLGRDADDDVCGLVDGDGSADDVGVAVEPHFPEAVSDHRFGLRSRPIVRRGEAASERQRDANGREVIAGDVHRGQRNRGALPCRLEQAVAAAPSGDDDPVTVASRTSR